MVKASVIIPTYQGATKILNILKALEKQTSHDFETIVVVDGSTDATEHVLTEADFRIPVTVVIQKNKGRSGARNAGAAVAKSEILIFFDDDMLPLEDSIQRHINFHAENDYAIVTGATPQSQKFLTSDFAKYRAYLSEQWMAPYLKKFQLAPSDSFLVAANCSMPKPLFFRLDGFNETLKDAEDRDFAIRASRHGIQLYFDKDNTALHNEKITCRSYILRLRQYAKANKALNEIHPSLPAIGAKSLSLKKTVYFLLAFSWIVTAIDAFNIFMILPRKFRYKLYDAVTFALAQQYPEVNI